MAPFVNPETDRLLLSEKMKVAKEGSRRGQQLEIPPLIESVALIRQRTLPHISECRNIRARALPSRLLAASTPTKATFPTLYYSHLGYKHELPRPVLTLLFSFPYKHY